MEELKRAVAFIFKRKGGESIDETEFLYSASMGLRWFTPKEAQRLLDLAVSFGLVEKGEEKLQLKFEMASVEIPIDFKPSKAILELKPPEQQATPGGEQPPEDMLSRLLDKLAAATGLEKQKLISEINEKQERMLVDIEVAALMVANSRGIDLKEDIQDVRTLVVSRS